MAKSRSGPWAPPADIPRVLVEKPAWFDGRYARLPIWRLNQAMILGGQVLWAAVAYFRPVRIYLCFSGGYDSAASTVFSLARLNSDPLLAALGRPWTELRVLHINTGIGIEATRQYVRDFCAQLPFEEYKTPESYEEFVLAHGFPGPGMHARCYQRFKERAIRLAAKAAKAGHSRRSLVMFVSGIRHDESAARAGYQRCVSKVRGQVWVNPLYWADHEDFAAIRRIYQVPANPVREILGMSGECCCGAYAEPGELARVRLACPATADYLEALERQVRAAGHDWGWEDPGPPSRRRRKGKIEAIYAPDGADFRPLCASCEKVKAVPVMSPSGVRIAALRHRILARRRP